MTAVSTCPSCGRRFWKTCPLCGDPAAAQGRQERALTDEELADLVLRSVRLEDVAGRYTGLASDSAGRLAGRCPFCKGWGFSVLRQLYRCQECGACGDVISFVMRAEKLTREAAAGRLCRRNGLLPPRL